MRSLPPPHPSRLPATRAHPLDSTQCTAVDWLQDIAEAPIISKTWDEYAPGLRVHAGYSVTLRQRQALAQLPTYLAFRKLTQA